MRTNIFAYAIFIASILAVNGIAAAQTRSGPTRPEPVRAAEPELQIAQSNAAEPARSRNDFVDKINANTVTIVSGTPSGTWMYMAHDLSVVLDDGENMRVLAVIGKGSAQNIRDILYLRGVDMGIVQANILQHFQKTGEVGKNIGDRLRYIARLHNQEIHILVRPEINKIEDLRGKKVNFANKGSGSQITAQLLFEKLGIEVEEVNMQISDSIDQMRSGDVYATFFSTGKPGGAFTKVPGDTGLKFLNIPYEGVVKEDFLPATFTHEDYPNLVPEGQTVQTLAESAVLVSFNWPPNTDRYRRVAKFTQTFFEKFDEFLADSRHPKWKEVNLAATLPGWTRFAAAEEMVKTLRQEQSLAQAKVKGDFDRFLTGVSPAGGQDAGNENDHEKLFRDFMEWRARQSAQ
jgi:TRAP transporter TAXI family solute receptor